MATNAICIVNVIRLQKPSPKARLTASGEAPFSIAARETITTAIATKTKASGNQRSAQVVNEIAIRTSNPSFWFGPLDAASDLAQLACDMPQIPRVVLVSTRCAMDIAKQAA